MQTATALEGGFSTPVYDAQAAFIAAMEALSRPGRAVSGLPAVAPPEPLGATAGALIAALADPDTPVWLDAPLRESKAVAAWIGFHTGAPVTDHASEADFAIASEPERLPGLELFALGSAEYPDRSTTIILQVDGLDAGENWRLTGPGIKTEAMIAPAPMPQHFLTQWQVNRQRFPRGVDMLLAAPDAIVGLPRSVAIEPMEG